MDTRPIGVFDSGLGGLTAVRQLRRVLPGEDIVYFGDTGRVPYGSRGRDIIVQYARQDIRFLLQQDVKFIIAACGTVSSTYPPEEAARLPVPFTGVVGATARAAVDATRNRKIGIIGTAATVRSGSYAAIIRDMMPDVQIFARACPMFVPLVENGYFNDGNPVTKLIIAEYLQELKDAGQKWLDAAGTENAKAAADALAKEIKEDICTVDDVIGFFETADAVKLFGEETAKNVAAHAREIKSKGAKWCDCPACAAGLRILENAALLA